MVGLLIDGRELEVRNAEADPDFVTQLRRQLEQATRTRSAGFLAGVRALIELELPKGDCDVDRVAVALGMSRRSFQRRLAAHGASFSQLQDDARRAVVVPLLLESDRSVERVADLLGFSSSSSFNQWFRQRFDCSPSAYRAKPTNDVAALQF
jgi:AraC-like DNA-binding protein